MHYTQIVKYSIYENNNGIVVITAFYDVMNREVEDAWRGEEYSPGTTQVRARSYLKIKATKAILSMFTHKKRGDHQASPFFVIIDPDDYL